MNLQEFNDTSADRLRPMLAACCDVPRWVETVLGGRPYADAQALSRTADRGVRDLGDAEVGLALAAHPRIGDRPDGDSTEASWSRGEQAGVGEDAEVRAALAAGNREYEQRFGRVFLICATGLSAQQMLTDLRRRLTNDEVTEAGVVRDELRKIALLRLAKVVDVNRRFWHERAKRVHHQAQRMLCLIRARSEARTWMSTVTTHVLDTGLGRPARGVPVRLSRPASPQPVEIAKGSTDDDGRISDLTPGELEPGVYQLWFDIDAYAAASGQDFFFPEVTVTFTITAERHYHVPLLLSPFAFSTYRGS